jgi:hypothetical protein
MYNCIVETAVVSTLFAAGLSNDLFLYYFNLCYQEDDDHEVLRRRRVVPFKIRAGLALF